MREVGGFSLTREGEIKRASCVHWRIGECVYWKTAPAYPHQLSADLDENLFAVHACVREKNLFVAGVLESRMV
jgi:hypothetical protein